MALTFNEYIAESKLYQSFVTKLSPLLTEPRFGQYLSPMYNKTKNWQGVEAVIGRIPMASLVDEHSGRPLIGTAKPASIMGQLPTFGNSITFSSDDLDKIEELEDAIRRNVAQPDMLVEFLVTRYMDLLAGAPLTAIDKLMFEAWSNGTCTIAAADNLAKLPLQIDWDIKKYHVAKVWTDATDATPLLDLKNFYKKIDADLGITVDTFTMNESELDKVLAAASTKTAITSYLQQGAGSIKITGMPSQDNVDLLLTGQYRLPKISTINHKIDIFAENGIDIKSRINAFQDGRVAATVGTELGYFMYTPAAEQKRPDKYKAYANAPNEVLLASVTRNGSVYMESTLNAIPVLTIRKKMAILLTDDTSTGDALV